MISNIDNWNKIPTETYKSIVDDAIVRYDELLSQSENITSKIIQIILAISVLVSWYASFIFQHSFLNKDYVVIGFVILCIYVYFMLVSMLFPREKVVLRGSSVSDSFFNEEELINDTYSDDEKIKAYYFTKAWRYKKRIDAFRKICNQRSKQYECRLILSLLLFSYVIISVLIISL